MKDLDMQIEDLQLGNQYSNEEVRSTFRCSLQSGMNKSNTTNTLVLIINHIKSIYHDRWLDNKVHHIGKGQVGDQTMTRENKTLSESNTNGVKLIFLKSLGRESISIAARFIYTKSPTKKSNSIKTEILERFGFSRWSLMIILDRLRILKLKSFSKPNSIKLKNLAMKSWKTKQTTCQIYLDSEKSLPCVIKETLTSLPTL